MRATLIFNLPEEKEEFELAQKAGALHWVVWGMTQYLRNKTKYEDIETIKVEEVKEELWRLIKEYDCENQF